MAILLRFRRRRRQRALSHTRRAMNVLASEVSTQPDDVRASVRNDSPSQSPEEAWRGAKVVITATPIAPPPEEADPITWSRWRGEKRLVSPHATELASLFTDINNYFGRSIAYYPFDPAGIEIRGAHIIVGTGGKYEFFGRLADAATRYQDVHPEEESLRGILKAVLDEAFLMLEEMEAAT